MNIQWEINIMFQQLAHSVSLVLQRKLFLKEKDAVKQQNGVSYFSTLQSSG